MVRHNATTKQERSKLGKPRERARAKARQDAHGCAIKPFSDQQRKQKAAIEFSSHPASMTSVRPLQSAVKCQMHRRVDRDCHAWRAQAGTCWTLRTEKYSK